MNLRTRDLISRWFSRGNYAAAYESEDYDLAVDKNPTTSETAAQAFTLGFFSSYELGEMGAHADTYAEAYFSETGAACLQAGYIDTRDFENVEGDDS